MKINEVLAESVDFKNGHRVIFDRHTMSILEGPFDQDNWHNDMMQNAVDEHGANIAAADYNDGEWFVSNSGKQINLNGYHLNAHSMDV